MSKKLKLALLATSVMFFPKGTYAADQDDNLKTLTSRPASLNQQPDFIDEPNIDVQSSAGPSRSQVDIANSSSEVDFNPDQFPEKLTIKGRDLYTDVLRSNIGTNIDLKRYFDFSNLQGYNEALAMVNIVNGLLMDKGREPLQEVRKKLQELEDRFRAQIKAQFKVQFKNSAERSSKQLAFTTAFYNLKWSNDEVIEKEATEEILSSYSSMLEDLPLYIELFQQKKHAESFLDKIRYGRDLTGFTETLADILKETPENSRNLIERMARPFLKMESLEKSRKQSLWEYLSFKTSDVSVASASSSSTPAPAMPALELDTREFHMGQSSPYPTSGFSGFEGSHRWTLGKEATISFSDMTPRPSRVSFLNTGGLITTTHTQELLVKVNGNVFKSYVYAPGNNNHTLEIPLPKDGPAIIEFEIPTAASPSDLGINPDKRVLGILFRKVQFSFD